MADHAKNMNDAASPSPALPPGDGLRLISALPFRMAKPLPSRVISRKLWTLEMFTTGKLAVSVAGSSWRTFGRDQGLLYPPNTPYREKNAGGSAACQSLCLLFEIEDAPMFDPWRALVHPYRGIEDPQNLLLPLVEQVLRHHTLPGPDALLARGAFMQVMGHLLRAAPAGERLIVTESRSHEDLLTRAHRLMRANLHKPLSLPDFATATEMSESGFAHAYKRLAGISPMVKLRRLRIEAAKAHLAAGQHTLSQIARLTGFADAVHLSRTFKKITGFSPRDFRQM
jgi:AraC-like DNA-binding protein